jgi:hypothetical protein
MVKATGKAPLKGLCRVVPLLTRRGLEPGRWLTLSLLKIQEWWKQGTATYYFLTRAGAGLRKRTKEGAKPGRMPLSTAALDRVLSVSPAESGWATPFSRSSGSPPARG